MNSVYTQVSKANESLDADGKISEAILYLVEKYKLEDPALLVEFSSKMLFLAVLGTADLTKHEDGDTILFINSNDLELQMNTVNTMGKDRMH